MKLAISGKGGVGKSTIISLLGRILKEHGKDVILIDADPDLSLSRLMGIADLSSIKPITEMKELIAERTETQVGKSNPIYKMNPKVSDIPDTYSMNVNGIKLMVMGTMQLGGGGCACPENTFLKSLLSHLMLNRKEWVLVDMEAGVEHLGRGTAIGVNELLVIVEPSFSSVDTCTRIKKLATDLGIKNLSIIGNKIQSQEEIEFIKSNLSAFDISGLIPMSDEIRKINTLKESIFSIKGEAVKIIEDMCRQKKWID